jgi:hypothetical protein
MYNIEQMFDFVKGSGNRGKIARIWQICCFWGPAGLRLGEGRDHVSNHGNLEERNRFYLEGRHVRSK